MWPLRDFESDCIFTPEIANPPRWDGIVVFAVVRMALSRLGL
jgi:hypothetical protein